MFLMIVLLVIQLLEVGKKYFLIVITLKSVITNYLASLIASKAAS